MSSLSGPLNRAARQTYHPKGYGVSEGLKRARRPFRVANAITGILITSFAFSVYFYSIRAVKQDDFSDVLLPSDEIRLATISIEDEQKDRQKIKDALRDEWALGEASGVSVPLGLEKKVESLIEGERQALVGVARRRWPSAWDSVRVLGAPPVDRLGKVSEVRNDLPTKRMV